MKTFVLFTFLGLGAGLVCSTVSCSQGAGACGPLNCSGCCSASGTCEGGSDPTACGTGGAQCAACTGAQTCTASGCSGGISDGGGQDSGTSSDSGSPADSGHPGNDAGPGSDGGHALQTVFLLMMENTNWADIQGNVTGAPYLNGTLLPMGGHAENYFGPMAPFLGTPSTVHTSLENYLWLEAGTNFGLWDNDNPPPANVQTTDQHLVDLLENAGVSWGSWQEDIDGGSCPLAGVANYAPKHNPFVYFTDVTDGGDPQAPRCLAHVRPYGEFQTRLSAGTLPRYNFITPNLCDDMHTLCGGPTTTKQGDTWLSQNVPAILASPQFAQGGVLFILWDESEIDATCALANCRIPLFVLSPYAKTADGGYAGMVTYDHSWMLRTVEEIFGVTPYLGGAADAGDLVDFFTRFP